MARTKGDFEFSANFEVKKKATLDARQYVNNYSELLEFTASDYIPYGFPVACGGQDDPTKLGIWQCVNPNDLSNPLSWVRSNEPIPFNQVIQVGSFSLNTVTYLATLGEPTAWAFNENGINYEVGETDVQMNAPDSTYTRADIIVWSSAAGYQLIEGTPAEDYQIPNTPVGTILVQTIIRNVDGSTEPVEPPDLSGFAKLAGGNNFNGKQRFSGERYIEVQGSDRAGLRGFDVSGNYLGDFQFENSPSFKGFKLSKNINFPANPTIASTPLMVVNAEDNHTKFFGTVEGNNPVNPQDFVTKSFFLSNYQQHFRGKFPSLVSLESNVFDPPLIAGDYAQVDEGTGSQVKNYNWDADDEEWVEGGSGSAATNTDMLPEGSTNLYFTVARVLATLLTGYSVGSNVAIAATDTILQAFGKVQAQINAKQDTLTFDSSPTSGSTNPVTSGGVFTALGDKLTGTLAADADLQTQTTPAEDNKFVSRHGLIFFWNWLRTQAVEWTNTFRATRFGAGIAPNVASKVTVAAGSTSETQLILTPRTSANNYTGTIAGSLDNIDGVPKFRDATAQTDLIKKDRNPSLSSVNTLNIIVSNADGSLAVGGQVRQRQITDTDIITAITGASYTDNRATISVSGKTAYAGQVYNPTTGTYNYIVQQDNVIRRY